MTQGQKAGCGAPLLWSCRLAARSYSSDGSGAVWCSWWRGEYEDEINKEGDANCNIVNEELEVERCQTRGKGVGYASVNLEANPYVVFQDSE
jgi:hypothetical protein